MKFPTDIKNSIPHKKTGMKIPILDRYIARNIIGTILVVSIALLSLDLFFTLVNELKLVGRGTYTLRSALSFLALSAPTRFYAMFPWAALLGTLISLGSLAGNRELVVMRTASISVLRICYSVVKAAFILTIFIVIIGEALRPLLIALPKIKKQWLSVVVNLLKLYMDYGSVRDEILSMCVLLIALRNCLASHAISLMLTANCRK